MARSPLQMRSGRAALPGNLSVQSGGTLAGYLASGGRPQLSGVGVQQGGNLAAYVSGQTPQQLTVRRGGSLAQYLRRRKHPPYNPDQPRRPKGRPTGGEWMTYTAAQKAAFLRRAGRAPFELPPDEEEDVDLSPFETRLQAGGLLVLATIFGEMRQLFRELISQREQQYRAPRFTLSTRLMLGESERRDLESAPMGPSARRIR